MVRLILQSGDEPQTYTFSEVCRIGRDPSNEIPLDDTGASRKHCRVTRDGSGWVLEDLKSANGTFRNDERVDRVRLNHGDQIQIGQSVLLFEERDGPEEIELDFGGTAEGGGSQFEILFRSGDRAGERFPLDGRITLGRKPSNTVSLADTKVSGVHAEVVIEEGRAVVRDLGSTNGTYLEGKRIDEIVLDHGDRVVLGDSEFLLLDTTKEEPVGKPDFMDEAQQTIVDIPRVKVVHDVSRTRSPMAAIGLLLLVGGLAGASFFYWHVQSKSAGVAFVPPAPGNMLGDGWSFEVNDADEDPSADWILGNGTSAAFEIATTGGQTGLQALTAAVVEGNPAIATLANPLTTTTRSYQIRASGKSRGDAVGVVVAKFFELDRPDLASRIPIGSVSGDWGELQKEVTPPEGMNRLQLELVAAGGDGEVWFDDLSVVEGGMSSGTRKGVHQFDFERVGPAIRVHQGGEEVMRILPLTFTAPGGELEFSVDQYLAGGDSGEMLLANGEKTTYASKLEFDDRSITWRVDWKKVSPSAAERLTLPITLFAPLTDAAVGVVRKAQLDPYRESFSVDEADGLILGIGPSRMRVTFDRLIGLEGRQGGDRFELFLKPGLADGNLVLRVQVDFVTEKTEAKKLLGDARDAEAEGRLGTALGVLDRITNEFPFDEQVLADSEARRGRILRQREEMMRAIRDSSERADFLGSAVAFQDAEELAARGAAAFEGTPSAAEFEERRKQLAADREIRLRALEERNAELLLARLETALAQDPPHQRVAAAVASYLQARFPWSEAAKVAAEKVNH